MPRTKNDTGIACVACGGHNTRIVRTTPERGYVLRRHECRDCGERTTTSERHVVGKQPSGIDAGLLKLNIGQIRDSLDIIEGISGQRT